MKYFKYLILLVVLVGCESPIYYEGQFFDTADVQAIQIGVHKQEDVKAILGDPTDMGAPMKSSAQKVWYYIGQKMHTPPLSLPEVMERRIFAIYFDDKGVVQGIRQLSLADGQTIEMADGKTPTPGREEDLVHEFISNIGRFTPKPGIGNGSRGFGPKWAQ